jgi:hypothetical protein
MSFTPDDEGDSQMSFSNFSDTNENIDRVHLDTPDMSAKGNHRREVSKMSFHRHDASSVTILNAAAAAQNPSLVSSSTIAMKSGLKYNRASTLSRPIPSSIGMPTTYQAIG